MVSALVANVAALVGIAAIGFAIDSRANSGAKLAALPWYSQFLVGGAAISPIVFFAERLAVGPVDGVVAAFGLSVALWIGLPTVFAWATNTEAVATRSTCWLSTLPVVGGER